MRFLFASLALLAAAPSPAAPPGPVAPLRFLRVWPLWLTADSFQSYYEYHTGRELIGKWIVMRSQPEERTGLYFLARVDNRRAIERGATFVVRVISPDDPQTRVFNFPATIKAGSWLYEIGLTGKDWALGHVYPVAWDVELQTADGAVAAKTASFLWEKPKG
jgi:hypothetical protein